MIKSVEEELEMKKFCLITIALILSNIVSAGILETQGFETDISGWGPYGGSSTVTRVASGTNGITSSSGDYHAEIFMDGSVHMTATANGGGYTYPGGGVHLLPGFEKAIYSVDVYLDPSTYVNGDQWDMQVSMSINGDGVTTDNGYKTFSFVCKMADGTLTLGRNSGTPSPIIVSEAGWYTMSTEWTETANGLVDYNYIYHNGTQYEVGVGVNNVNLTGASYDTGYQWLFGYDDKDHTVAIDNATFEVTGVVPEPATLALLGLGGLLLRKRK